MKTLVVLCSTLYSVHSLQRRTHHLQDRVTHIPVERVFDIVPVTQYLPKVPVPAPGPVRLVHVEPPVPKKRIGLGTNDGKSAGKYNFGTRATAIPQTPS